MTPLVVGIGGALGAVARWAGTEWVRGFAGDAFPWGTLAVNVLGSFALGFAMIWFQSLAPSPRARQLVAIGFLGSFTTFSTFSYEAVALVRSGAMTRAGLYAVGSVASGVTAVLMGAALASVLVPTRS